MAGKRYEPDAPRHPRWDDVVTFPWHPSNLKVWVYSVLALILLALLVCGFRALRDVIVQEIPDHLVWSGAAMLVYRGGWSIFAFLCVFSLVASLYPSAYFVRVVEETASGGTRIAWSADAWYECGGKLLFMLWMGVVSLAAAGALLGGLFFAVPEMVPVLKWAAVLSLAAVIFPFPLLSALTGGAFWVVFQPRLVARMVQKPHLPLLAVLGSVVLAAPCLLLALWLVLGPHWWLTPAAGALWGTTLFVYARLLGQVAYILTSDEPRRKRKKRRRAEDEDEDED